LNILQGNYFAVCLNERDVITADRDMAQLVLAITFDRNLALESIAITADYDSIAWVAIAYDVARSGLRESRAGDCEK